MDLGLIKQIVEQFFPDGALGQNVSFLGQKKVFHRQDGQKVLNQPGGRGIKSLTIVRMEVPCCGGLEQAAKTALQQSEKFIPWQVVTISTDGRILD